MKINDLRSKLSAASEKEYRCAPSALTPQQLHDVLSSVVMEELKPCR